MRVRIATESLTSEGKRAGFDSAQPTPSTAPLLLAEWSRSQPPVKKTIYMTIRALCNYLEQIAPSAYQESYDNAGLIVGDPNAEIKGVMICLDSTEAVVDEASEKGCNLIIAHHPIVFRGLKRFNGRTYVERVVMQAIKNEIAIYAIHTNLDNVYLQGVNAKISEKIGLINTRILSPKKMLKKLTFISAMAKEAALKQAVQEALPLQVDKSNYLITSLPLTTNGGVEKIKVELLLPSAGYRGILNTLEGKQLLEPGSIEISEVENKSRYVGSGMIGELPKPLDEMAFLKHLKKVMQVGCVKYTQLLNRPIQKVALCGGAGGFLLSTAIAKGADIFITADYKYHEFFDADGKIVIADIGHYESEQFTIELLFEIISEKFSNFAAYCTKVNTNPVNYL